MSDFSETYVSPDGRTVTARTPGEANDLRYGQGYRLATDEESARHRGGSTEDTLQPSPEPAQEPSPAEAPEKTGRKTKTPDPVQDTK